MKQPFRVAFVGRPCPQADHLLAGLSPAFQPRVYGDWGDLDADFDAEVVAVLPGGSPAPPSGSGLSYASVLLNDLNLTCAELETRLWDARVFRPPQSRLLGVSAVMARVRGVLTTMAKTPLPLLLTGENGTGKDLAATVAHDLSPRAGQAFVAVNCGAIPSALAESEFFGCVRGAFTGAENRTGFCQQAMGGTLFLDEVAELPAEVQSKLLRVLENHELRRVGAIRVESTDFRLICATNRDLATEVKAGRFREDLYYRINVLALRMPPLRERTEDLPLLAEHFLASERLELGNVRVGCRAMAVMKAYPWPGNLRQLRNVLLRAAVIHGGPELEPQHLEWDD